MVGFYCLKSARFYFFNHACIFFIVLPHKIAHPNYYFFNHTCIFFIVSPHNSGTLHQSCIYSFIRFTSLIRHLKFSIAHGGVLPPEIRTLYFFNRTCIFYIVLLHNSGTVYFPIAHGGVIRHAIRTFFFHSRIYIFLRVTSLFRYL